MRGNDHFAVIWPTSERVKSWHVQIPYHFVHLAEVAGYLDRYFSGEVDVLDAEAEHLTLDDIARVAMQEYRAVALYVDFENLRGAFRTARHIKEIAPSTQVLAYGDVPLYLPALFTDASFDAIVRSGDHERAIADFFECSVGARTLENLRGLVLVQDRTISSTNPGLLLPSDEWGVAVDGRVSFALYNQLQGVDRLVVTVGRGCPFGCAFCTAPRYYGPHCRTRPISDLAAFVNANYPAHRRYKFFMPNFTLDPVFVREFSAMMRSFADVRWSCTTHPHLLADPSMVEAMASGGCKTIAMGVETLNETEQALLGKVCDEERLRSAVSLMHRMEITPKALVMLGVPGQTRTSVLDTFRTLDEMRCVIRPTLYSPFQSLEGTCTIDDAETYDKRTGVGAVAGLSRTQLLRLLYDPSDYRRILDG